MQLGFNRDKLGTKIRESAVADYLELWALKSYSPTLADVDDFLIDIEGGKDRARERYEYEFETSDFSLSDSDDAWNSDALADRAFSHIRERISALGHDYPFRLENGRLMMKSSESITSKAKLYLSLLAVTLVHGSHENSGWSPTDELENLVVSSLSSVLSVVGFGTGTQGSERERMSFIARLADALRQVSIEPHPKPEVVNPSWKDAGVDVIASLDWGDSRPGRWIFLGQCTCSGEEKLINKISDISPTIWSEFFLAEKVFPRTFLAVPYVMPGNSLRHFHARGSGLLIDRIRLTLLWKEDAAVDERLIETLRESVLEDGPFVENLDCSDRGNA